MPDDAPSQAPPRLFTRRQAILAGATVAAATSGWIFLKSRQSSGEPPLALLHAGDEASRDFVFALQREMRKLGAEQARVFGGVSAANESLRDLTRGIYGLVAAGKVEGGNQIAVVAEIRDASWHMPLWTQRRRVEARQVQQGAEFWYTALAATLASASRGVFSSRMRANPGAIRSYEMALAPLLRAGALLPLNEDDLPRDTWPAADLTRMETNLRDALAIDSAFPVARGQLALTLAWAGRWEEASKEAAQALVEDQRLWTANYAMALAHTQASNDGGACLSLGRCVETSPFHLEAAVRITPGCGAAFSLAREVRYALPHHVAWLRQT